MIVHKLHLFDHFSLTQPHIIHFILFSFCLITFNLSQKLLWILTLQPPFITVKYHILTLARQCLFWADRCIQILFKTYRWGISRIWPMCWLRTSWFWTRWIAKVWGLNRKGYLFILWEKLCIFWSSSWIDTSTHSYLFVN